MQKFAVSYTKIAAILLAGLTLNSCQFDTRSIKGSGNVTTETRALSGEFSRIEAEKGLDVVVEQGPSASVTVEADDNLQSHITTKIEGGVLKINSDYNSYHNVKSKKVTVKMPVIKGIQTGTGVSLTSANILKSDEISITASSGSDIEIEVESDRIITEASSGSHITLTGKALSLETSSSSGSDIDAGKLLANEVSAHSSSGSSTDVHAILKLDAKASSGGSVDYYGTPKTFTREENSGGSVSNK